MFDRHFAGLSLTSAEDRGVQRPISRVTLLVDDENAITAGDDTGLELTASCPHATQAMANAILAQVKGYRYHMMEAGDVRIDPAAELGDGITAGGIYSVISRISDDGSGYPGVTAPGEAELEDEYPSGGPMTQEFNRKIAQTRSRITKTAEQIKLEVYNEIKGLSSSITVELDNITSKVEGLNGQVSSIRQYVDNITLEVSNGSDSSTITLKSGSATISSKEIYMNGLVTFTGLANGTTIIDGGCIKTGSIDAGRLNLTGAITFSDLNQGTQQTINNIGSTASSAQSAASSAQTQAANAWNKAVEALNAANSNSLPNYIKSTYIDATTVQSPTLQGNIVVGGSFYGSNFNVISQSSSGGFHLYATYNGGLYNMFDISYQMWAGTVPQVHLSSPASATIYCKGSFDFSGATVTGLSTTARFA